MSKPLHEENRRSWNEATRAHNSHKGDQARYLREGGSTVASTDLELLGDVRGLDLAHLQCNSGQDSLSLAKLGARVVGVDISDEAIEFARILSQESGIGASFARADVYDWFGQTAAGPARFDVCYSSHGVLMWLSDLDAWARGVASVLKPGGRLVLVDYHPFALIFDERKVQTRPYFAGQSFVEQAGVGDYVARAGTGIVSWGYEKGVENFRNSHPCHEFQWGAGELLSAVLSAGLTLTTFREYPFGIGSRLFEELVVGANGRSTFPEGISNMPLTFGLVAQQR